MCEEAKSVYPNLYGVLMRSSWASTMMMATVFERQLMTPTLLRVAEVGAGTRRARTILVSAVLHVRPGEHGLVSLGSAVRARWLSRRWSDERIRLDLELTGSEPNLLRAIQHLRHRGCVIRLRRPAPIAIRSGGGVGRSRR